MFTDYWNIFSSELKDALSNIMYTSSLKTLSLAGVMITKVPITIYSDDFCNENLSLLTWAASKGMAPTASHTVINRCMWRLEEDSELHFEHASRYEIILLVSH